MGLHKIEILHEEYQSYPRFRGMVSQLKTCIQSFGLPKDKTEIDNLISFTDSFMPNYMSDAYLQDVGRIIDISVIEDEIYFSWAGYHDFLVIKVSQ